jgi:hypothetical protein
VLHEEVVRILVERAGIWVATFRSRFSNGFTQPEPVSIVATQIREPIEQRIGEERRDHVVDRTRRQQPLEGRLAERLGSPARPHSCSYGVPSVAAVDHERHRLR